MINVHTGIDHGDDSGAANAKAVLCVLQPDDLCRGLDHISVPSDAAVIIHRSSVVKPGGDAGERRLGDGEESIRFDTHNSQEGLDEGEGAVDQVAKQIVGRSHEKGLANWAV